jgi:MFS family permease
MEREPGLHYAWMVVWGGFLITALLHSMIQTCFSLFLTPVTEEMHISRTAFSLCTSLVAIATVLLSPTMGRLLGRSRLTRPIFLLCIVCMGLSYASYSLAQNVYQMYASAVMVGIFSCGAVSMPVSILIVKWFKKSRGLALSIALAGSGIGGSVITPVLSRLIASKGWRMGFLIFGFAMIILEVPVAFFFMRPLPEDGSIRPYGEDKEDTTEVLAPDYQEIQADIPLSELKRQPFFYIYLIGMFAVSFVGYGSLSHLSAHLTDVYNATFSNAIISFFLLILTPAKIGLGWIYDKIGATVGTIFVMSFHAVSFLMLQITGNETLMWIMAFFFAIGISNGTVAPSVVTAALFGTREYGTIFGYVYSFCMLGMMLGSPFIAAVYDLTGTYRLAWAACFALCLLAIVSLVYADVSCRKAFAERL